LFPLVGILILTACAVRTPVQQVSLSDVAQNLKYKNVIFKKFTVAPNCKANVPTAGPLLECKSSAIAYLNEKDIFIRVEKVDTKQSGKVFENPYDEPTLFVDADLTFCRIVSSAARFWGGVMVGRSSMIMVVKLTDASSGSLVVEQELVGAPNAHSSAWSFGSSDRSLPTKMGYLLGDFILANVSERQH
jgi:hypothetical protein